MDVCAGLLLAVLLAGDDDLTFKGTTAPDGSAVLVQSLDGPGLLGTNVELRPKASRVLPPDYYWPAEAADSIAAPRGSGLSVGQVVGIVLGSVAGVLLVLAAVFAAWNKKWRRYSREHQYLPDKRSLDTAPIGSNSSGRSIPTQSNNGSAVSIPKPGDAYIAGSIVGMDTAATRDLLSPLPAGGLGLESRPSGSAAAASSGTNASALAGSLQSAGVSSSATRSSSSDSITLGLDRWKAAISTTTMQLMERRMQMTSASVSSASVRTPSGASSRKTAGASFGSSRSLQGMAAARHSSCLGCRYTC